MSGTEDPGDSGTFFDHQKAQAVAMAEAWAKFPQEPAVCEFPRPVYLGLQTLSREIGVSFSESLVILATGSNPHFFSLCSKLWGEYLRDNVGGGDE